jgi:hypothetical protein
VGNDAPFPIIHEAECQRMEQIFHKAPDMLLEQHWAEIAGVVASAQSSMRHCAIASVDPQGIPNITPIGTVFLRGDATGFYFDQYTDALANNLETNANVCLLAVNTGPAFWFRSLLRGKFVSPPGVRLYGTVGPLRAATAGEMLAVNRRVRPTRWLKGHRLLWSSFSQVRDIRFTSFRPVRYPVMTEHLWQRRVEQAP